MTLQVDTHREEAQRRVARRRRVDGGVADV